MALFIFFVNKGQTLLRLLKGRFWDWTFFRGWLGLFLEGGGGLGSYQFFCQYRTYTFKALLWPFLGLHLF